MPSIAQQDYIVIAPKVADIEHDAYALGYLAKILEKKDTSIFDVIIKYDGLNSSKISGVCEGEEDFSASVAFIVSEDPTKIYYILIPYTSTQYEGLAAVQEAGVEDSDLPDLKEKLPTLERSDDGFLYEEQTATIMTDLEGHKISVTAADGKLATVAVSEETDPDGIQVPFEEIQKLVGLPITV